MNAPLVNCPDCGKLVVATFPLPIHDCKPKKPPRKCPHCGMVFIPNSHNQRFCSYQCRWNNRKELRTIHATLDSLRGCPNCEHVWFEDLDSPIKGKGKPESCSTKVTQDKLPIIAEALETAKLSILRSASTKDVQAKQLAEALRETLAHAEDMTCELENTDDLSGFPYIQRARAALAAWEAAQ